MKHLSQIKGLSGGAVVVEVLMESSYLFRPRCGSSGFWSILDEWQAYENSYVEH